VEEESRGARRRLYTHAPSSFWIESLSVITLHEHTFKTSSHALGSVYIRGVYKLKHVQYRGLLFRTSKETCCLLILFFEKGDTEAHTMVHSVDDFGGKA
jgi:hypothetical protein